ncbi:hypothetical protein D3C84_1281850 [compost metagenome]
MSFLRHRIKGGDHNGIGTRHLIFFQAAGVTAKQQDVNTFCALPFRRWFNGFVIKLSEAGFFLRLAEVV